MDNIQVFSNDQFGQVRTVFKDGEPWFVVADVCRALEIQNHKDAIKRLDSDEKSGVDLADPHGRVQTTNCVNKPGLYTLVLGSRKPEAKAFKLWITHEVIPTIRKTGGYVNNEDMFVESYFPHVDEFTKTFLRAQLTEVRMAQKEIEQLKPKAEYYDIVLRNPNVVPISVIAKDYGMSAQSMNALLHDMGIQYRCANKYWLPYQKHASKGYTHSSTYLDKQGNTHMQTNWTQEGRLFIYEQLKREGILPLVERKQIV